jgi:GNAT superfamily N-acetyltransferase
MKTSTPQGSADQADANNVIIRTARASGIPEITRMLWDDEQGRARESVSTEDSAAYLSAFEQIEGDPNSQVFVATLDGAVVGCLQLTVIPGLSYRGVRRALVEDVRVERSCRDRGIGGLLLAHAESQATDLGCGLIELFVHGDRESGPVAF